jgi:hypothetical protein
VNERVRRWVRRIAVRLAFAYAQRVARFRTRPSLRNHIRSISRAICTSSGCKCGRERADHGNARLRHRPISVDEWRRDHPACLRAASADGTEFVNRAEHWSSLWHRCRRYLASGSNDWVGVIRHLQASLSTFRSGTGDGACRARWIESHHPGLLATRDEPASIN